MFKTVKNMISLMENQKKELYISLLLSLIDSVVACMPFIILYEIAMKMPEFNKAAVSRLTLSEFKIYAIILIATVVIRIIIRYFILYFRSGAGYKCMCKERKILGKELRKVPLSYFTEKNVGDLVTTVTSDAAFLEIEGIGVIEKISIGIPGLIIGLVICLAFDYKIFLAVSILFIPTWIAYRHLKTRQEKLHINRQEVIGQVAEDTLEFLKGINVIKSYNMTEKQFKKTQESYEEMCRFAISTEFAHIIPAGIFQFCFRCITVVIVFFSGSLYIKNEFSFAQMTILMFISAILFTATEQMGIFSIFSNMSQQSIDRMNRIKKIKKIDNVLLGNHKVRSYDIEFKNVEFGYKENLVLKSIDFKAKEQTSTALVGLSGSGKTTIINLIARFWNVNSGEVKIGGKNINDINYEELLKNISFVFQECFLFNDTVLNNLKIGRIDATLNEVYEASKKAGCHDFIMDLPYGYETNLGEAGSRLSGGEKQRICIARALIKNSPIVLLDEMTANVDVENESEIHKALEELLKDKTVIIIAHNLTTIKNVDQILVLENGIIGQKGTHRALVEKEGLYKKLWNLQYQSEIWNL